MLTSNPDYHTTHGANLAPTQVTQARRLSYRLFSQLYLEGLTAVALPIVQSIPELAVTLPEKFDADTASAEYQALFGFNIFPYESFFLGSSGLIGGTVTDEVIQQYQQASFLLDSNVTSPDHIGHQLAFVAHLLDQPTTPQIGDFLHHHLLRWLPPFVLAIQQQGHPFYVALAELTLAFVADHAQDIQSATSPVSPLPSAPSLLDNEKTSLKDIGRFLTMPVHSGFYLGREDVARLARQLDLPRGFGGREQMLTNLMKTAVQYDALPTVLTDLLKLAETWQADYATMGVDSPVLKPFVTIWQTRVGATAVVLQQIQRKAKELIPPE